MPMYHKESNSPSWPGLFNLGRRQGKSPIFYLEFCFTQPPAGHVLLLSSTVGILPRDGTVVTPGNYTVVTPGLPNSNAVFRHLRLLSRTGYLSGCHSYQRDFQIKRYFGGRSSDLFCASQFSSLLIEDCWVFRPRVHDRDQICRISGALGSWWVDFRSPRGMSYYSS
jgi:hypothetical protein